MAALNELQGPVVCPACQNAEVPRQGFLKRASSSEDSQSIAGRRVDFECMTCHALFEVEQ